MRSDRRLDMFLLLSFLGVLLWSGIAPRDRLTWLLEVLPAIIGVGILVSLHPRRRPTDLVLVLIWIHAAILCVGGHYTYAEVPAFNWLRDEYGLARNYYDRVGHVAQGFVPAMIAREILLRLSVVNGRTWLFFLATCVCMAISAFYEFIEWWVALASDEAAEAFLGTQGDVWDTQWDMFLAMLGAIAAQLLLGRWHDTLLARGREVWTGRG
jgi:putative membrane protein